MGLKTETIGDVGVHKPFELEKPRTEKEVAALRRKIVTIARIFSSNGNIQVRPTLTDEEPWGCSLGSDADRYYQEFMAGARETLVDVPREVFQPKTLYYTRSSLRNHTLEEILGVLRHEIGHANNTDYRLWFEGQRFVAQEGYMPMAWINLMNALEDTWVNNQEIKKSDTIREQMETRYKARTPDLEEYTPKLPINLQLGKMILHYWITGQNMPTVTDRRVQEAFEQVKTFVNQFAQGANAEENFQLVKEKIWPVYKQLEEQAQKDAQNQQMIDQLLNQQQQPGGQTGQGQEEQAQSGQGSAESQGLGKGGLLQKLQQILQGQKNAQQQTGSSEKSSQGQQQPSNQLRQTVDPSVLQHLEQEASRMEAAHQQMGKPNEPVKVGELSEQLIQELTETFNNLPEDLKKQLIEQAMQQMEQQAVEELKKEQHHSFAKFERNKQTGRMELQLNTPTQKEAEKIDQEMDRLEKEEQAEEAAQEQARQKAEQEQQARLQAEQVRQRLLREMKKAGFEEHEEDDYAKFRTYENSVLSHVRRFIDRVLPALPKHEEVAYEGLYPTGKRLDIKALPKKVPVGDTRVMNRKEVRVSEEARIYATLLIDNSGSMDGEKMEESIKTAIFFARVLRILNVPFAIKLFGTQVETLMKFEQDYDDPRFRIKPKLIFETDASGSSTDIGSPLIESQEEMLKARRIYPDSQGMIFLITDGRANMGLVGEALTQRAQEISKLFPIFVFGLGMGRNDGFKQYLEGIFGEGRIVMPTTFSELPNEAGRVLFVQMSRLLRRFQN